MLNTTDLAVNCKLCAPGSVCVTLHATTTLCIVMEGPTDWWVEMFGGGELSSICLIMGGVVPHLSHHGGGGELSSICLIMGGVVPHLSHHGGRVVLHLSHHGGSCPPSVSSWGLSSICLIMGGVDLHLSHHGGGEGVVVLWARLFGFFSYCQALYNLSDDRIDV